MEVFSTPDIIYVAKWALGVATYTYISSSLSNNYSSTDRLWSLVPILYTGLFVYLRSPALHPRHLLMLAVVSLWGLRLTWNFWRRGGFEWDGEDYRWQWLRSSWFSWGGSSSSLAWVAFNFFFISLYQHALIFLFTAPAGVAAASSEPLNAFDALATLGCLASIALEWTADNQQYAFKSRRPNSFCTSGLWAYSRHPNFVGEMGMWIFYYLFSVATHSWNYSALGALLLVLLFQGSYRVTELITASKYRAYQRYQRDVPALIFFT